MPPVLGGGTWTATNSEDQRALGEKPGREVKSATGPVTVGTKVLSLLSLKSLLLTAHWQQLGKYLEEHQKLEEEQLPGTQKTDGEKSGRAPNAKTTVLYLERTKQLS